MKWILYIMLFTAPAVNIKGADQTCLAHRDVSEINDILKCRPIFEGKHIWSLQSTSQLEFSTFESCVRTQDKLIANSNVASTMTLRTWCFCEVMKDEKDKCPTEPLAAAIAAAYRECEKRDTVDCQPKVSEAIKEFNERARPAGPSLAPPPPTTSNSSSIRLYPP